MNIKRLQAWINSREYPKGHRLLTEDGVFGPLSQRAFIRTFENKAAPAITVLEENSIALDLGGHTGLVQNLARLRAVAEVEGAQSGWDNDGRLKCLYERHYMWKRLKKKIPLLSDPAPGGYTHDADKNGINDSWEKVASAIKAGGLNYAIECASWGKFQVMGAWWSDLGYLSPLDMLVMLSEDEAAHYDLMARYVKVNKLQAAFRQIDGIPANCVAFARGYNGPNHAKGNYAGKIATAYRKHINKIS